MRREVSERFTASQNSQMIYCPCTGALRESKDANDIGAARAGTILTYDLFGRLTQAVLADGGQTDVTYNDPSRTITTTTKRTSSESISVVDNFNTLGLLTQRDLPGSRKVVITYDELLREWKVTNPHVSTGDSTYGLVETRFDALGRIKTVVNQDGNSSVFEYKGNATKLQDESSKQRLLVTDAFGRLTKVCEITAGNTRSPNDNCNVSGFTASGYPTTFQYNLLDKLTQIQQGPSGQQQTRTLGYDNLGRQTAARILEVSTGSDVTYAYQDDGDLLTSVTDPRGTVHYEYDSLHRLKKKKHGTTVVAEHAYDGTAANQPTATD